MTQDLNSQVFIIEIGTLIVTQKPMCDCIKCICNYQKVKQPKCSEAK